MPFRASKSRKDNNMEIRKAEKKNIKKIMDLLNQILEIHAEIRPDIFIGGTSKYTREQLKKIIKNPATPIYVALDGEELVGHVFCAFTEYPETNDTYGYKSVHIDDFCVDENYRGKGVGRALFEHVKAQAEYNGCREITLNVWKGNAGAEKFYDAIGFKPRYTFLEYKI